MSDDDDALDGASAAVTEVPAAAPEAGRGWSEQDRRTLIITVVGGLAANVSTVILVGAALAFMHVAASPQANDSAILIVALVILVVGFAMIVVGTFLRGIFG